jgi:hypothetical protein
VEGGKATGDFVKYRLNEDVEENGMLKKRRIVIISALAGAMILTMGLVGGVAYANSSTATTKTASNPQTVLADKVATILGVDSSKVEAAFTEAQKEIQSEAQDAQLQKLVDAGTITQDQATEYKTWIESRPDVNIPGLEGGMGGGMGRGGMMGHGAGAPPDAPPAEQSGTDSNSN